LATSHDLKPAYLPWLIREDLLPHRSVERLAIVATREGREDLIRASRKHQLFAGLSKPVRNAALFQATALRRTALADFWVEEGAEPDAPVRGEISTIDLAAKTYSVGLLRRLDTHGKYAALLAEVTKDYPPAAHSRFLGHWSNKRDGFSTVAFMLGPDGTGYMGAAITSFPLLWKPLGPESLELVVVGPQGPMKDKAIVLHWKADGYVRNSQGLTVWSAYESTIERLTIESAPDKVMIVPNDQAGPFYRITPAAP
jgi:hypothetical protein